MSAKTTDLSTLRAARDAARKTITTLDYTPWLSHDSRTECYRCHLDALLRLHGQVVTLENAEKLEAHRSENLMGRIERRRGFDAAARFLRATVEDA